MYLRAPLTQRGRNCCTFQGGDSVAIILLRVVLPLCPYYFCNHLIEEERAGCFTLIAFLLLCLSLFVCLFLIVAQVGM